MKNKLNIKQKKFQKNKKAFLLMTVLCMGIGFAFLSSNLTITGNTSVSGNKWNVYFTNVQVNEASVEASVVPTTSGTNTTSLDYTVTLDKPGDFYEFTVDAVNNGTIDAMIQSINMTSLDTDVAKYLSYTATYSYGATLDSDDVLEKNTTETYKVRVEYKTDVSAEDLNEDGINLNLTFGVNYTQSDISNKLTEFTKLVKNSALRDRNIDFTQGSSETNGKGLYVLDSTKTDEYPIYYYRGDIENNNAKFAGFCWKIVRTTETGGTKLIYNGTPDGNGDCNATGLATQLSAKSTFNEQNNSLAYNGYMYGTVYQKGYGYYYDSHIYGNTFTYENGTYTLSDTHTGIDENHHYTCFDETETCSQLYYVYYASGNLDYITLTDGKDLDDAFSEMNINTNNSTMKTAVDNWFNETFKTYFTNNGKNYNDYLEDTVWCNDRSINQYSGWNPNGGRLNSLLTYSAYERFRTGTPTLTCSNKNDSFTVTESAIGNGALTYPVGLLTADEIILAGGTNSDNTSYYLYTNQTWWTMSPHTFESGDYYAGGYYVSNNGRLYGNGVYDTRGVRPSISVKPSVKIATGGDGTAQNPYEFVVE